MAGNAAVTESPYISLSIMLFILSMITERVANFLKLWLGRIPHSWFEYLSIPQEDKRKEKKREGNILLFNCIVGICIAWLCLDEIQQVLSQIVGWQPDSFVVVFLGGFFLSFGSKFWHDLVDLLLEVKNYRRALTDEKTYAAAQSGIDLNQIIEAYSSEIMAMNGINGVGVAHNGATPCMDVHGEVWAKNIFMNKYAERLKGIPYQYTIDSVAKPNVGLHPSDCIANPQNTVSGGTLQFGTLSCFVKEKSTTPGKSPLLLTCYHVVKPRGQSWEEFKSGNSNTSVVNCGGNPLVTIGTLRSGRRTAWIDAALVEVEMQHTVNNFIPGKQKISADIRYLDSSDVNTTSLSFLGVTSLNKKTGIVTGIRLSKKIQYFQPDELFPLLDLIAISHNGKAPSQAGDSGAVVFDGEGKTIGIVVGQSDTVTLVIPIQNILDDFNITIL